MDLVSSAVSELDDTRLLWSSYNLALGQCHVYDIIKPVFEI